MSSEYVAENIRFWRCARQQLQHAPDGMDEAHVEHAIGFIEHEALDVAQVDRALLGEIEQPAGRRDQQVAAVREARRSAG